MVLTLAPNFTLSSQNPSLKSHNTMLLQATNLNLYPNLLSFSSGFHQNQAFHLKHPIIFTNYHKTHKNSIFITCSSVFNTNSQEKAGYEKRAYVKWSVAHRKISMLKDSNLGAASVLNQMENEGKLLSKWELCRIVKELRKFRRYKYALEVYEWMNNRAEKYRTTSSDTAIQLDLIAKVHGISSAEQYFQKLPETLKDKRIYGSLLNAYVRAKMTEKAESMMDKMKNQGYATHSLSYNVMMTLYMNLENKEKIELLVGEMEEKNIPLDIYSYNIWLSSCESVEKMERVFERLQLDKNIEPNWTTFCTMASLYIKAEEFEKAEESLRKIENQTMRWDRLQYHYLINLYGNAGKTEDIYRIWNLYKANFINIPNLGYHAMISSLVRTNDIDGAEKIYKEWVLAKSVYDPRVGNLLLGSYVRNGFSLKAKAFVEEMIEDGGKPNATTWEFLAEDFIRRGNVPEALTYMQKAASASVEGSTSWKPRTNNVVSILGLVELKGDVTSKDALFDIMKQVGCFDDSGYMSCISISDGGVFNSSVSEVHDRVENNGDDDSGDFVLLGALQESL